MKKALLFLIILLVLPIGIKAQSDLLITLDVDTTNFVTADYLMDYTGATIIDTGITDSIYVNSASWYLTGFTDEDFLLRVDTVIVFDHKECDTVFSEVYYNEKGEKFYKNMEINCITYYKEIEKEIKYSKLQWIIDNFDKIKQFVDKLEMKK